MLAIAGATGTVGAALTNALLAKGQTVRVLTRDAAKAAAAFGDRVEIAAVDHDEPETLAAAFAGCDRAFLSTGTSDRQVADEIAQIDAAVRAGVSYIVELSSFGAADGTGDNVHGWHHEIDAHLATRGVDFTLIRPTVFVSSIVGLAAPFVRNGAWGGVAGQGRAALIDARDVANVAARLLLDGPAQHAGKVYDLSGPVGLSIGDIARYISAATGSAVEYHHRTEEEQRAVLASVGVPPLSIDVLLFLDDVVRSGESAAPSATTFVLTGKAPRSVEAWVMENAAIFKRAPVQA
jgi:NAD(P)H dehydrogenase (quinone)